MLKIRVLGVVLLSIAVAADGIILRVPDDFDNIQTAIDESMDGDIVIVSPGLYKEQINFQGRAITVTSEDPNDPEVVADTIIEGDGADSQASVVTFNQGESQDSVLTGFTIRGGYGTILDITGGDPIYWGGGVVCVASSPMILRNRIIDNEGPMSLESGPFGYGAGIACIQSEAVVAYNTITRNSAYAAGGVFTYMGDTLVYGNLIYNNSAFVVGGVALFGGQLINNTIVSNALLGTAQGLPANGDYGNLYIVSEEGAGIFCWVKNNIICGAKAGNGVVVQGLLTDWFAYNDVWGNLPSDYQAYDPQTGAVLPGSNLTGQFGNISEDPLFENLQAYDLHLSGLSPCIDAGDPGLVALVDQKDIDRESRIWGTAMDIGADEYPACSRPLANAGPDQRVYTLEPIALDGSASTFCDPCATTLFRWTQVEGPAVSLSDPCAVQPTFVPPVAGRYRFHLMVSDGKFQSRPDEVVVRAGNSGPIADAGQDRLYPPPSEIHLDGSNSTDPEDDTVTYQWRQAGGPEVQLLGAQTAAPWFTLQKPGAYTFELIVSDGQLDSAPDTVRIVTMDMTLVQKTLSPAFSTTGYFHYPDVDGTKVVYAVGSGTNFTWDIICKDLLTSQLLTFRSIGGQGLDTQPRIHGDTIVWSGGPVYGNPWGNQPSNLGIYAAQISSGKVYILRPYTLTSSYSHPVVYGTKVVWLEHLNLDLGPNGQQVNRWWNTPFSICGADITNPDKPVYFTVAQDVGSRDPYACYTYTADFDHGVDLWGNTVVWESDGDIFGADISDLSHIRTFPVCTHYAKQSDPVVYGQTVLWTDARNDSGDIYSADIGHPEAIVETALVKAAGTQMQPAVDRQIVVYTDGSEIKAVRSVPGYGLIALPLQGSPQGMGPAVSGDTLIWQTANYGTVQGLSMRVGASVAEGPVENSITGDRYPCIQDAIVTAEDGDLILISPGTYREDVDLCGRAVTLSSVDPNDWDTVMATVIDGFAASLVCSNGETPETVIQGLSLMGALNGVACSGSAPLLTRCCISDNINSGVVLRNRSGLTLDRCLITGNGGAGIECISYIMPGRGVMIPNVPIFSQCLIAGNRLQGIAGDKPTVGNCTIVENGLEGISSTAFTVTDSIVYYNGPRALWPSGASASLTYSDVEGGPAGLGNLDAAPVFVACGRWVQGADLNQLGQPGDPGTLWIKGDYHLTSDSPVVDKGNPETGMADETDLSGRPRVQGDRIDMGAFERES